MWAPEDTTSGTEEVSGGVPDASMTHVENAEYDEDRERMGRKKAGTGGGGASTRLQNENI